LTSSVDWTVKLWRAKVSDVFNFVKTAIWCISFYPIFCLVCFQGIHSTHSDCSFVFVWTLWWLCLWCQMVAFSSCHVWICGWKWPIRSLGFEYQHRGKWQEGMGRE
jgi:hypothetical protein